MKALIVDFHAGCIQALALTLESIGVEVKVISLSEHNFIFNSSDAQRWALDPIERDFILKKIGLRSKKISKAARLFGIKKKATTDKAEFDYAFSMFPPALALAVHNSGIARKTVMLAAHRADLWISRKNEREKFWKRLTELRNSKSFYLAAASEFDSKYINFYKPEFEIEILKLDAPHIRHLAQLQPSVDGTLIFGINLLNEESKSSFLSRLPGPHFYAETHLPKNYTYEELLSYSNFGYVPYSAYSIKLLELEMSGRQIWIPNFQELSESESLQDVRLWPFYGQERKIQAFKQDSMHSLNSGNPKTFANWIEFAQWEYLNPELKNRLLSRNFSEVLDEINQESQVRKDRLRKYVHAMDSDF